MSLSFEELKLKVGSFFCITDNKCNNGRTYKLLRYSKEHLQFYLKQGALEYRYDFKDKIPKCLIIKEVKS